MALAFDERVGSEVFQTRARAAQRLTTAFRAGIRVHQKAKSNPNTFPTIWTLGYFHALTMNSNH
jgi:hypothetical protein